MARERPTPDGGEAQGGSGVARPAARSQPTLPDPAGAAELSVAARVLRVHSAINNAILQVDTDEDLLDAACKRLVTVGGYRLAWFGYVQDAPGDPVRPVAHASSEQRSLDGLDVTWADGPRGRGRGPTGRAVHADRPVVCQEILNDPELEPWRDDARAHGYASSVALPVKVDGAVAGTLAVHADRPDAFGELEVALLAEVASDLGSALSTLAGREARMEAERSLAASEARFQRLLETAPDAMVLADEQGTVVLANERVKDVFGYRPEEVLGCKVEELIPNRFHPDHVAHREAYVRDPSVRPMGAGLELWGLHKDGHEIPVEVSLSPFETDGALMVMAAVRNVTLQREARAELKARAEALARSNAELERFAYVASHDLQEPLRMVHSYIQLLERRLDGQLDDETREFMGFAREGADRMRALVTGLLEFSRAEREGEPHAPVDCETLFEEVIRALAGSIEATGAEVTRGELPTVMADRGQLGQVFQNLVSNAIKFQRQGVVPRVHVDASDEGDEVHFRVEDNGIGIEADYQDVVFEIFKRLHTRETFPGTGVGLAIVKRIIEQHGGRIWVVSKPDEGSTFHFTLPKGAGQDGATPDDAGATRADDDATVSPGTSP